MTDDISVDKRTFSRQEMYDLVWSVPIQKLAERFGLSDRGLAKTCLRHQVPVPGRGYWAKIDAGRPVLRTPLARLDNPGLEPVHVTPYKREVNPYVAYAIEQAKEAVSTSMERRVSAPKKPVLRESIPLKEPARSKEPVLFEPVRRYHAAISGLSGELRSMKPNDYGEVSAPGLHVAPGSVTRTVTLIHYLIVELEARGLTITHNEGGFSAGLGPDDVRFELGESRRREKHVPTPTEQKRRDDYERRRDFANRRGQWLPYEKFWPEYDYVHEGKLSLEVINWADGARKRWSDGRTQSLESMLESIADGILYHVHFDRARREKREADERRRKHLAYRRDLQERRLERETKRQEFLQRLADDQREAAQLRETIEGASKLLSEAGPEYRAMIDWARRRLQVLESCNELEVLSGMLKEQNLVPEPDDLFDPEGEPPPKTNYWD